jgi:hypothetical protein
MSHFKQRTPYAGSSHFVTFAELREVLPLVDTKIFLATIGSTIAKPNTSHEVTASRAGSPSGRTA